MGNMARLCHEHAAVDVQGVAGDVGGFFGGEEGYGVGDIGVGAHAAEGDVLGHGRFLVVGEDGGHGGFDVAGGDRIHGYRPACELAGEGFGEADEAGFGGGVVGLTGLTGLAYDGGDVDDASPAVFDHLRHDGLSHEKGSSEIGGEDVIPVFALHAHGEDVAGDSGVVDEDVDGSEVCEGGFGAVADGLFAGDVEGESVGASSGGVDGVGDLVELVEIAGGEGDGSSAAGEFEGAGTAYALRGSGNQCDTT
jgi:hypothetical protein